MADIAITTALEGIQQVQAGLATLGRTIGSQLPAATAQSTRGLANFQRGVAVVQDRVRVALEHVFAAQKCRLGLVVRSVGLARATARVGLANLVTNMRRSVWFTTRAAPA